MKTIGVIPARYASIRFPAKVLAKIAGKPMIQHVWQKVKHCEQLDEILIACDHEEVYKVAKEFGANVVMTRSDHPSGSDRIAEAIENLNVGIVVNIQGDEPFIDSRTIDNLVLLLKKDSDCLMGTVIKEIIDEADFLNPNIVKCVTDCNGYALFFSRASIPYPRNVGSKRYKHLGLYSYRKDFLMKFKHWPKGVLESTEELEQLRVLEKGYRIKTVITTSESIAVDTPEDLEKAEQWYAQSR